jgi:hypothetical protein
VCGVLLARTVRPRFLGLEGRDKRHFWHNLLRKLGHKADVKVGGHLYTRASVVEIWSKIVSSC